MANSTPPPIDAPDASDTSRDSRRVGRGWLRAAGLLLLTTLLGAGGEPVSYSQRYQEVAAMSPGERIRLQQNFQTFEQLSEEQKNHFRKLHDVIEEDARLGPTGRNLQRVLATYAEWLNTLTPGQRDDLRRETDLRKRLEMIRKFKADQAERMESGLLADAVPPAASPRLPGMGRIGPRPLTPNELKAVGEALEKYVPFDVRQRELGNLTGLPRFRKTLGFVMREGGGKGRWPQERQLDELLAVLPADEAKDLQAAPLEERRHRFVAMMARGVAMQMTEELRKFLPSESQLEETFSKLDGAQRDEIMRHSADETRRMLTRRYFENQSDPQIRQLIESQKELQDLIGRPFGNGNRRMGPDGRPEPPPRFGPPGLFNPPPPEDRDRPPRNDR